MPEMNDCVKETSSKAMRENKTMFERLPSGLFSSFSSFSAWCGKNFEFGKKPQLHKIVKIRQGQIVESLCYHDRKKKGVSVCNTNKCLNEPIGFIGVCKKNRHLWESGMYCVPCFKRFDAKKGMRFSYG